MKYLLAVKLSQNKRRFSLVISYFTRLSRLTRIKIFVFLLPFEHRRIQSVPNTHMKTNWTYAKTPNILCEHCVNRLRTEEQWEKDLEAELQDYEVVNEGNDRSNWEKDVDELLDDETDLK